MSVSSHPAIQTPSEPGQTLRERLKTDLTCAMKARQTSTITTIRMLLAAIDNAEAVPLTTAPASIDGRTPDVPRTVLRAMDIHGILTREADECRQAATTYVRLGQHAAADAMRTALAVIESYQLWMADEASRPAHGFVEVAE